MSGPRLPSPRLGASRRAVLGGALALASGCRKRPDDAADDRTRRSAPTATGGRETPVAAASSSARGTPPGFLEVPLDFPEGPVGPEKALAIVPQQGDAGARYPVLVALHGRGESVRGLDAGARGWMDDYELGHAMERLQSPPLLREDFRGFVDDARLAHLNASLESRPFRGLVVVCPWVPDILSSRDRPNLDAAMPFGSFVVDHLLPRVIAETPALGERASTGIDGVSLGGRAALMVGFAHADRFAAIGTLQAALQDSEAPAIAARAKSALSHGPLRIRLLTSDRDPFLGAIAQLHLALDEQRIDHEHLVIPGPHDYIFNRGPGGIEMLLWHDRILRGEPAL